MSCAILLKQQSIERLEYVKLIIKMGVSKTRHKQRSDSTHIYWHEVFLLNKRTPLLADTLESQQRTKRKPTQYLKDHGKKKLPSLPLDWRINKSTHLVVNIQILLHLWAWGKMNFCKRRRKKAIRGYKIVIVKNGFSFSLLHQRLKGDNHKVNEQKNVTDATK